MYTLVTMENKKYGLKLHLIIIFFSLILAYRTIRDIFRRMQKIDGEPIVINPNEIRIWMVGHATVLINFFGTTILTDPVLVNFLPFPKRVVEPGYNADELPALDYIIVSHAHFDHFNIRSLKKLAPKTKTLVIPRNCFDLVEKFPFGKIVELDWNKDLIQDDLAITSYKPVHWGKRVPWETMNRGYNCYVLEKNGRAVFFGGDTAYGTHFRSIGEKHEIDIALLPISAYKPAFLSAHHMNPHEAYDAFSDLGSNHCIPIHWGSFRLTLEDMDEPPQLFRNRAIQEGTEDRTHILENGCSFSLQGLESEIATSISNMMPELAPERVRIKN